MDVGKLSKNTLKEHFMIDDILLKAIIYPISSALNDPDDIEEEYDDDLDDDSDIEDDWEEDDDWADDDDDDDEDEGDDDYDDMN
jgi:hypothetical protein